MGQYHMLVNIDKQEYVNPTDIGLGLKQYEHSYGEGTLADAMYILTMTSPSRGGGDFPNTIASGRWVGDRVIILGDYTEASDIPFVLNGEQLWSRVEEDYTNISNEVLDALSAVFGFSYKVKALSVGTSTFDMVERVYEEKGE